MQIIQMNLLDMLDIYGADKCQHSLSSFTCPLNADVENFLHKQAITFATQHITMTFLVFLEQDKELLLLGYYALTNKFVSITCNNLSKTMQRKIRKFSQYDTNLQRYLLSVPLIAQLGKNYSIPNISTYISGTDLLNLACNRIIQVQRIIGGKMTYIECASNDKLFEFYTSNDFFEFGVREKESKTGTEESTLVQMIRYFK